MISYNVYWIVIITAFLAMRYNEAKGHWPFMKPKKSTEQSVEGTDSDHVSNSAQSGSSAALEKGHNAVETIQPVATKEVE